MSRSQIYDGAAWVDMQGHGGYEDTWLDALFNRPSDETVHVDDQEFSGAIGGTAVTPSGTAVWSQDKGQLAVVVDDTTSGDIAARMYPLTPASYPVTIETAFYIDGFTKGNFAMSGIVFAEGTSTSDIVSTVMMYHEDNAGAAMNIIVETGTYTAVTGGTQLSAWTMIGNLGFVHLRLIWSAANTFKAQVSHNGIRWVDVDMAISDTNTPTHIGVFSSTFGDSTPVYVSWEYLRVTESDLSV